MEICDKSFRNDSFGWPGQIYNARGIQDSKESLVVIKCPAYFKR